jgi:hypothetical protein
MNSFQEQVEGTKQAGDVPPTTEQNATECNSPTMKQNLNYSMFDHRKAMESSFYIFPESPEENEIQKARAILGELVKDIPDEEMAIYITQFRYLLDSWLDQYEKEIFNNLTLRQLLQER